jgi:uncharacterized protein YrzB (UPF0473 family)
MKRGNEMSDHIHDENCEHDQEEEIIELEDDNGNVIECIPQFSFEVEGKVYIVLVDRNNMEAEVLIFRIEEDSEEYLVNIDDDAEWQKVLAAYENIIEEASQEQ